MIAASSPVAFSPSGSVYNLTHQLATGRVNVIAAGSAHRHYKAGVGQHLPEPTDRIATGTLVARVGEIVGENREEFSIRRERIQRRVEERSERR